MSYYNHRDYYLATADRARAQAAYAQAANIRNQIHARMDRQSKEWQGSHGDPRASISNMYNAMARENSGYHQEMSNRNLEGQQAYATALSKEVAQMQDRMADMAENRISSKNRSDEMAYNLAKYQADLQAGSLNKLTSGLSDFNFEMPEVGVPSVNLHDNDGQRIGGSYPSLFAKTGIKNSLMGA